MATYVNNLRLKEIATGDESGQWGTTTNTNLELIGEALGFGTRAIANASTDNITVADGSSDSDRAMYLKLTGGGQACTVTLLPNTVSKLWFMENGTNSALTFTQGSGANVIIPSGDTKLIATNGGGSGAIVYDVFASLSTVDLKVQDDLTLSSDGAVVSFGADADTTLTHTDGTGLTLNSTNKLCFNDASQFIQGASATVLDIAATDTIELTATTTAIVGNQTVSGTLVSTGKITADAGIDIDNFNIDGTTIALSTGDLTVDVAGDIILNADGDDFKFQNAAVNLLTITNSSSDAVIKPATDAKDIIFQQFDGTAVMTVEDDVSLTVNNDVSVVGRAFSPTLTTNLGSAIDLSLGNNFLITTTGDVVLTFTNQIAGQSGTMKFVNDSNRAVTAHTNVAISEADLATISATGTYMVSYFVTAASAANTILVSASAILT